MADSTDSYTNPPAIVIYIVDAFLSSGRGRTEGVEEEEGDEFESGSLWLLGLLRCYTEMLQTLPETMRPALVLQVGKIFTGEVLTSFISDQHQHLCPINCLYFRWCPASIFSSQLVERTICICNNCAPWLFPVTPNADVCSPSKHTSSP